MIDSFVRYIAYEKRYSQHTITSYLTDLNQFSDFLESNYEEELPKASYPMIRDWIVSLVEANTPKTINRKIATLRSFYKYLMRKGVIEKDPTTKIKAPKVKKSLPVFVEEKSLHQLLDNINFDDDFSGIRDKLVLEFLYGTGMRLSELINLNSVDINPSTGTVKVLGKGNKERIIPLNNSLINSILIYNDLKKNTFNELKSNSFIVTDKGEKTYPVYIYRLVKKYLSIITSLEKKSPHILRHSFATHLLNKGADLNAIKELLGHSNLAATQVYTHNSLEKLKNIFNQAHPKA